jgi:putative ABC transport system substrate-binding protein
MKRRVFVFFCLLPTVLLLTVSLIEAQQTEKVYRLGYLSVRTAAHERRRIAAFQQGLQELGYTEGKNISIELRRAVVGQRERLRQLAAELVRLKVDVIVTTGGSSTQAAKEMTTTIPIVFTLSADPVGDGLVASLARPGGNVTGLSDLHSVLVTKRLELLKEVVPTATRVSVLLNPAFLTGNHRLQIVDLAVKNRLPTIFTGDRAVRAGGLMSYGASLPRMWRRAAVYVDKILKGARPADLPVEQAKKFRLVINLKAAKQLGVAIPSEVLLQATRVIK